MHYNKLTSLKKYIDTYLTAIGSGIIAVFVDSIKNPESSAIQKTTVSIRKILQITDGSTSSQQIFAILIFGIIAAFLAFVYKPKTPKESFLLGMSVLVIIGLSVPPVKDTDIVARPIKENPSSSSTKNETQSFNFNIFSILNAYAQPAPISPQENMVWIILEGVGQHQLPETRIMAYSGSSGNLQINVLTYTSSYIQIPSGTHQIEVSHFGYRSVSFKINPTQPISAYQINMEKVKFDSFSNFLGPKTISIEENKSLGELFEKNILECRKNNSDAASNLFKQTGIQKNTFHRETRRLLCI